MMFMMIALSLRSNSTRSDTISKQKSLVKSSKSSIGQPDHAKQLEDVYKNTFALMLQGAGARTAGKEHCIDMWSLLFSPPSLDWKSENVNWLQEWTNFITDSESIKGINRDQWNHVLKFAKLTLEDETLSFHSDEQSWPSIIDEFAEVMKKKIAKRTEDAEMVL